MKRSARLFVMVSPEFENFVQSRVSTGRYASATEVLQEALRLLEEHEKARAAPLAEFQPEVDRRLESLDRGEGRGADALRHRSGRGGGP